MIAKKVAPFTSVEYRLGIGWESDKYRVVVLVKIIRFPADPQPMSNRCPTAAQPLSSPYLLLIEYSLATVIPWP